MTLLFHKFLLQVNVLVIFYVEVWIGGDVHAE